MVIVIIFIVVRVALLILTILTDIITKLPVINQFNKLGGTIYGFLKGGLIVCTIFSIIFVLSPMINESFTKTINDSHLGKAIYNNNILINIIF